MSLNILEIHQEKYELSCSKEYKDSDILSKVEGSSRHEFIEIVLEELSYNLKVLVDAILVKKVIKN